MATADTVGTTASILAVQASGCSAVIQLYVIARPIPDIPSVHADRVGAEGWAVEVQVTLLDGIKEVVSETSAFKFSLLLLAAHVYGQFGGSGHIDSTLAEPDFDEHLLTLVVIAVQRMGVGAGKADAPEAGPDAIYLMFALRRQGCVREVCVLAGSPTNCSTVQGQLVGSYGDPVRVLVVFRNRIAEFQVVAVL